jgi:hypothetical protein
MLKLKSKKLDRYYEIIKVIKFKRELFLKKYVALPNIIILNEEQLMWIREQWLCSEITHIYGMKVYIDRAIKTDYDIKIMLGM